MPVIRRRPLLGALATAAAPRVALAQGNEVRIGALFPFSGTLAQLGDESFRGLELAVEERNAAGGVAGRAVRLVRGDAVDQAQAVAEARRLMTTERVAAIFGTYASPPAFAATQVAEVQGIAYFELGALSDSITERGLRGVFRTCPRAADYGVVSVDAVLDVLAPAWGVDGSLLRLALLHEDGLDGTGVAAAQEAELRRRNVLQIERIGYAARSAEFAPWCSACAAPAATWCCTPAGRTTSCCSSAPSRKRAGGRAWWWARAVAIRSPTPRVPSGPPSRA